MSYLATDLIADVHLRGMIPTSANSGSLSDANILRVLNQELQSYVVPTLTEIGGEYMVAISPVTTVAAQAAYSVPDRASGTKLRDVMCRTDSGSNYYPLQRLDPAQATIAGGSVNQGRPTHYYVQMDSVYLVPTPDAAYSVLLKYYRAPSELVTTGYTTSAGVVSGSQGAQAIAVTLSTALGADEAVVSVDFCRSVMPFTPIMDAVTATVETTGNLLDGIATDIDDLGGLALYACLAGTSPVPQIPEAAIPLLVNRAIVVCLRALGDPKVEAAEAACAREEERVRNLLSPRTEGLAMKIVNTNSPGWRRGPYGYFYSRSS
jgi:hypothetical protein